MRLLSVFYQRDFLPSKDADHWLNWLQQGSNVAWVRESFSIFGRHVTAPATLSMVWRSRPKLSVHRH